jgi:uncharacterized beta-barrel protein YwiB (DUF1934 family)
MQKVLLTIKGTNIENGEKELVEFVTEGRLQMNPNGYLLEYDETELTGEEGVTTKVLMEDGSVTLSRNGEIDTHMVFKENQVFESNVSSPFGMVHMNIFAHHVTSNINDNSGSLDLEYEVSTHDLSTTNRLNLSFKKVEDYVN